MTTALEYPNHTRPKSKIMPPCSAQTRWIVLHRVRCGVDLPCIVGVRRPWIPMLCRPIKRYIERLPWLIWHVLRAAFCIRMHRSVYKYTTVKWDLKRSVRRYMTVFARSTVIDSVAPSYVSWKNLLLEVKGTRAPVPHELATPCVNELCMHESCHILQPNCQNYTVGLWSISQTREFSLRGCMGARSPGTEFSMWNPAAKSSKSWSSLQTLFTDFDC